MATIRVGVGSFNIEDKGVGFGTSPTDGLGNLKVKGVTKTTGSIVSGASTLTRYSGFAADNINQLENITLTSEVGTIGDIVVGVGTSVIISSGSTVTVGTVESVSIGTHFSPPVGGIEDRGEDFVEGMMRFNTDLNTMEFYNGNEWRQFRYQADIQNSPGSRGRGVYGGQGPYAMDYINIASKGNSIYFGDFSTASGGIGDGAGNETRGIFSGHGPNYRAMQYITIASEGRSVSFGDATTNTSPNASNRVCEANSTRMLNMGDYLWTNVIDYVQIHTIGNALDFGDLSKKRSQGTGFSSPIRAMYCGGYTPGGTHLSDIEVVKFASLGNATHFGDLVKQRKTAGGGTSNSVRGVVGGGTLPATDDGVSFIEFVTLASEGNGTEFGNLTANTAYTGAVGSQTRAVFSGGSRNDASSNIIDFIEIATGGNAQDFGDIAGTTVFYNYGLSDCHGGLGGY